MPLNQPKYKDPETLEYVKDNIEKKSTQEMADHLGLTLGALRNQICRWRKANDLPPVPDNWKQKSLKLKKVTVSKFFSWSEYGNDILLGNSDHGINKAA